MEGINTGFVSREPREGCGKYCFGLGHNAHCGPSAKPPPRTARLRRAASPFTQEETQEKKQNHERERERERGGEGNEEAWRNKHRRRPREAEMMKVKKLGSLCWSATCRLKEQIRETAHPRTLTQPHSKSSSVPLAQRKPEPAKQTNRRASAAKRYYNSKPAAF